MRAGESERRGSPRARTRLRPGKLVGADGRFIADCLIVDRSPTGRRIGRLDRSPLPDTCFLLDEREGLASPVETVWSSERQAGFALAGPAVRLGSRAYLTVTGRYYAVRP